MSELIPPLSMNVPAAKFEARHYRLMLRNLVGAPGVNGPDHFKVRELAVPAMKVRVTVPTDDYATVYIPSSLNKQGIYECNLLNELEVDINPSDETEDRIDLIYAQVRDPQNVNTPNDEDWVVTKTTGVPDNPPSVPSLPDDAHALAKVLVEAGVGSVDDDDITDLREYCGLWRRGRGEIVTPATNSDGINLKSATAIDITDLTHTVTLLTDRRYKHKIKGILLVDSPSGTSSSARVWPTDGDDVAVGGENTLFQNVEGAQAAHGGVGEETEIPTSDQVDVTRKVMGQCSTAASTGTWRGDIADPGEYVITDVGGLDAPNGSDGQP